MKNKILIKGILFDICLAIFTCFIYTSCITPDVPVVSTHTTHVVYGYNDYGYRYHRRHLLPPPRRPVWIQHPSYRQNHNGFGNIRKDIRVPGRVDSRPIYPKNKNFGGRR